MGSRGMIALFAVSIAACACGGGRGDAMEPFVSRDGVYLFFKNNGAKRCIGTCRDPAGLDP
ncbi:MAG TPA: hypothetical protein VIH25_10230 [Steroidobacteraceae bacterium]